ncbi:endolytic transglycosylase MltG [Rhodoferax aquaticus]|uniref:Endolytic murein transglycosylase n=1 Tax=Rhodoferax aquaticus TaxID=2527691 RepID=A0A515EVU7_9BURK|nr:endolytic transglycosylase MltG [Rhodoferax aquaticus]
MLVAVCLLSGLSAYWWLNQPLALAASTVDLSIEPGATVREITQDVVDAGANVNPSAMYWWFRLSGQARKIKAGSYELDSSTTPISLLRKLVAGEESLRRVTLVEGWTFKQVRLALKNAEGLKGQTMDLADDALMRQLGKPGASPEGQFFPDTYAFAKGSTDLAVLQRASRAMDKKLAAVWAQRDKNASSRTPMDALILASIVEKETGRASDRALVSAVFNNRLRIGMRLQTDPTVIFGLGDSFDGNLRRIDLQTDTPWNTYTRNGLPPTPIAIPGKAALLAAVQPAKSNALYFVAKGDGSSYFSASLDEHNRAVNKYQRGQ